MNKRIESVMYNPITKYYLVDDDTGRTSSDLQKAMIVVGTDFAKTIQQTYPDYEVQNIHRPNPSMPHYISVLYVN